MVRKAERGEPKPKLGRFLNDPAATKRRETFKQALDANGIKPAELARLAGLSTPNAIYNFLNGHTADFSRLLWAAFLPHLSKSDPDQLLGLKSRGLLKETPAPVNVEYRPPGIDGASVTRVSDSFDRLNGEIRGLQLALNGCLHELAVMRVRLGDLADTALT